MIKTAGLIAVLSCVSALPAAQERKDLPELFSFSKRLVSSLSSPVCPLFQPHKKEKTFQSSFHSHSQHIMWPCTEAPTSRTPSLLDSSKDLEAPVLLPPPQLLPW